MSSCLKSGLPAENALRAAAGGAPEHLRQPLLHCAAKLTVGAGNAWRGLAEVPVLDDLARAGERAEKSGTALADALGDVASSYRSRAGDAAEATAERAGVLIAGPLALCFLPAFVVLGLVPTIAGLAEDMFAGMVPG
nr:type II secretion system F family protein [Corynebacterium lactis]